MTRRPGYTAMLCASVSLVLAGCSEEAAAPFDPESVQCFPMQIAKGAVPEVKSLMPDQEESRFSKERDADKALKERQKCLVKLVEGGDIPLGACVSLFMVPILAVAAVFILRDITKRGNEA